MDITEIKEKKDFLEREITGMINAFKSETGVMVKAIDLNIEEFVYGSAVCTGVKIETDL